MQNFKKSKAFLKSRTEYYSLYKKLQDHFSDEKLKRYSDPSVDPWSAIILETPNVNQSINMEEIIFLRLDGLDCYRNILLNEKERPKREWLKVLNSTIEKSYRWIEKYCEPTNEGIYLFHISGIIFGANESERILAVRERYKKWIKGNRDKLKTLIGTEVIYNNPRFDSREIEELYTSFEMRNQLIASITEFSALEPSLSYLIKLMQENQLNDISPHIVELIWLTGYGNILWGRTKESNQDKASMSQYIQASRKFTIEDLIYRFPLPGGYAGLVAQRF